jgi:dienelactone hydrolase
MGRRITIRGNDGSFGAYVADGKTRSGPAIVVIQEIFGVNRVMRDIAATIAWARAQGIRRSGLSATASAACWPS